GLLQVAREVKVSTARIPELKIASRGRRNVSRSVIGNFRLSIKEESARRTESNVSFAASSKYRLTIESGAVQLEGTRWEYAASEVQKRMTLRMKTFIILCVNGKAAALEQPTVWNQFPHKILFIA